MNTLFRRIVGLVVMGLLTGVLLRLIHQALQKMKGKTDALRGGALATFEVEGERFRVWTTNPQTIQDLRELQQGTSTANIPNGRILRGPGQASHNAPYHWHLDPQDIAMAEVAIEVCDGLPSYVEENVEEFVERVGRYCPWAARLAELRDYTGRVDQPPPAFGRESGSYMGWLRRSWVRSPSVTLLRTAWRWVRSLEARFDTSAPNP
jgi:hypothetical protein